MDKTMLDNLEDTILKNRLTEEEYILINTDIDLYQELSKIPDIELASKLLIDSITNNIPIILAVDIDFDGITSGYTGYYVLRHIFNVEVSNLKLAIGSREKGRGINKLIIEKIDRIVSNNNYPTFLLITSDHGSTDELAYIDLKKNYPGCKILVTDHHEVIEEEYPNHADVFINTQRKEATSLKNLCGCSTLFFTLVYTYFKLTNANDISIFNNVIKYPAMATIVDVMCLKDRLNRWLVNYGLQQEDDINISIIKKLLSTQPNLNYRDIGLAIGPLVNTANRLYAEEITLLGFITNKIDKKEEIFKYLNTLNKYRKEEVNYVVNNLLTDKELYNYPYASVLSVTTKSIIAGSIAASLTSIYSRPIICIGSTARDNKYIGSGRCSIPNLDLLSTIREVNNLAKEEIVTANGHKSACGVTIRKDKLSTFKELFNTIVKNQLDNLIIPPIEPEFTIEQKDLTIELANRVMSVSPYGKNFNPPVFTTIEEFTIVNYVRIKNFYKINLLTIDNNNIEAVFFNNVDVNILNFTDLIKPGMKVKLLFTIYISYYRKQYNLQLEIVKFLL